MVTVMCFNRMCGDLSLIHISFLLAFLQRFKQGLGGLARCGEVVDVLQLDGVHTARILHIHKVDDVELHAMGQDVYKRQRIYQVERVRIVRSCLS